MTNLRTQQHQNAGIPSILLIAASFLLFDFFALQIILIIFSSRETSFSSSIGQTGEEAGSQRELHTQSGACRNAFPGVDGTLFRRLSACSPFVCN